jgi:hypothetical protein
VPRPATTHSSNVVETSADVRPLWNLSRPSGVTTSRHHGKKSNRVAKGHSQKGQVLIASKRTKTRLREKDVEELERPRTLTATISSGHPSLSRLSSNGLGSNDVNLEVAESQRMHLITYSSYHYVDLNGFYPGSWHAFVTRVLVRLDWHSRCLNSANLRRITTSRIHTPIYQTSWAPTRKDCYDYKSSPPSSPTLHLYTQ